MFFKFEFRSIEREAGPLSVNIHVDKVVVWKDAVRFGCQAGLFVTMTSAADLSRTIGRRVLVEKECVTYKWLALECGISVTSAKHALAEFLKRGEGKSEADFAKAMYLVSGKPKVEEPCEQNRGEGGADPADDPVSTGEDGSTATTRESSESASQVCNASAISHKMILVSGENLEKAKAGFESIVSQHVYSVQPRELEASAVHNALAAVNRIKVQELASEDSESSESNLLRNGISAISFKAGPIAARHRVAAVAPRPIQGKSSNSANNLKAKGAIQGAFKNMGKGGKATNSKSFFANATKKAQAKPQKSTTSPAAAKKDEQAAANVESNSAPVPNDEEDEIEFDSKSKSIKRVSTGDSHNTKASSPIKKQKLAQPKRRNVIDSDDDDDDEEMSDAPKDCEAERMAQARKQVSEEELKEKERQKEERRAAKKAEQKRLKEAAELEKKERALEALGVKKAETSAETSNAGAEQSGGKKKTRRVKQTRKIMKEVVDEEGFMVTQEETIEEWVEVEVEGKTPTPKQSLGSPSKASPAPTKTSVKKPSTNGKMSSFFKKKQK